MARHGRQVEQRPGAVGTGKAGKNGKARGARKGGVRFGRQGVARYGQVERGKLRQARHIEDRFGAPWHNDVR